MKLTPEIETERLLLRAHRLEDFPALAASWADPIVVQYISGKPSTESQSWARIMNYLGHWQLLGFGYWAVEEKASQKYVGDVGFADFKRELTPSIAGLPELGWVLAPHFHGKGFASEATAAAMAWGEKNLGAKKTVCLISPENRASIRVAEKCGFKEVLRTEYTGLPTILFERPLRSALNP